VQAAKAETLKLSLPAVHAAAYGWKMIDIAERLVAVTLLPAVAPLLLAAATVIAILSHRSPFVAHRRVGQRGRPIWVIKLRTMWAGEHQRKFIFLERLPVACAPIPKQKSMGDPRITSRFAVFCRRYSIDELPQLWQVVRGEMALIAPRPLTQTELEIYYGAEAQELLMRKPGISGLWQVSGRSRLTYRQRRRLDLFMIRKWSFLLYLRILVATVPRVLAGKDAW
jgi:lipopolysaccharide/colanic/teichoic acid biosynthesis glycosyltransferase